MGEEATGAETWLVVPPPGARVVDSGAARWWAEGNGVVCNQSHLRLVTPEHLRAGFAVARELANGSRIALVAESGPLSETTREARRLLAGPEAAAIFSAMAVVVRSPVARTISPSPLVAPMAPGTALPVNTDHADDASSEP